jgi:hypothetical protein
MTGGYFLSSGILYNLARAAYERMNDAESDLMWGKTDAMVCLLFSAATLEAFIMELALLLPNDAMLSGVAALQATADAIDLAEDSRGSVQLKFQLAKYVLTGRPYDKGSQPYQDFDALVAIRNAIVHMKPVAITEDPNKLLLALRARKLCEEPKPGVTASWIGQICTRAVGRWACNVVVEMVDHLKGCIPSDVNTAPLFHSVLGNNWKRLE